MSIRKVANSTLLKISSIYLGLLEAITEREKGDEGKSNEKINSLNQLLQRENFTYHDLKSISIEYSVDPQQWITEMKRFVKRSISGDTSSLNEDKEYILSTTLYIRRLLSSKEVFKKAF
ncbi:hypothetical protein HYW75_04070 [Candidatus Pacearchaeota archaeon]|nr:hypothetical protein [Candidatus Pacearchaeota archaeon]